MTLAVSIAIVVILSLPALIFCKQLLGPNASASSRAALAIGAIVIFASLYPYWIFGPASAIGWYDEYDAIIPTYLLLRAGPTLDAFSHSFAGGTDLIAAYPDIGTGYLDLFRGTFAAFDPALAALLLRFFGNLLLYAGVFATARLLMRTPCWIGVVAALVAVFATAYPYAWLLGGYGWNFALMAWAPVLVFYDFGGRARLGWAALYGAITAVSATLIFFIPWVVLYTLMVGVLLRRKLWTAFLTSLPALLIAGAIVLIVNLPIIGGVLESLQSGRFLRITGRDALLSLFQGTARQTETLSMAIAEIGAGLNIMFLRGYNFVAGRGLSGFPPAVMFTAIGIVAVLWLTVRGRSLRYLAAVLIPVGLGAAFTLASKMLSQPALSAYRWDLLYICVPFLLSLIFAAFLAQIRGRGQSGAITARVTTAVLVTAVFISAGSLSQRAVNDMNAVGGWATLTNYPELGQIAQATPLIRAVSLPGYLPKPMLGPSYGLDVIDGVRRNFTWRRIAFWFETIPAKPGVNWHTHRHALGRGVEDVNFDALRLINAGLILSTKQLDAPELTLKARLPGTRLSALGGFYFRAISTLLPDLQLVPNLHVYAIDQNWDRVFAPTAVLQAGVQEFELDYFLKLRDLPRHALLIPKDAPVWMSTLSSAPITIKDVAKSPAGLTVRTGGEGGLLVYNQEFTAEWRATCGEQNLPLSAINAMHMVVAVPAGCLEVYFRSERWAVTNPAPPN